MPQGEKNVSPFRSDALERTGFLPPLIRASLLCSRRADAMITAARSPIRRKGRTEIQRDGGVGHDDVDARVGASADVHVRYRVGLLADALDAEREGAGGDVGDHVATALVGDGAGTGAFDADLGAGDWQAGGVRDGSDDASGLCGGPGRWNGEEAEGEREEEAGGKTAQWVRLAGAHGSSERSGAGGSSTY